MNLESAASGWVFGERAPPCGCDAIFEVPKNDEGLEAVAVDLRKEPTLAVTVEGREYRVPFGMGAWQRGGQLPMGRARSMGDGAYPVAASEGWTDPATLTVKACFHEAPFGATLSLRCAGDTLVLDREMNVGFGPTKRPASRAGPPPQPARRAENSRFKT